MRDKQKQNHNEQPDDFSKLVRRKLDNYRMPVDAGCWDNIELHMQPKRRKSLWWIGGSVAAIAVIVILLLSIPKNDEPPFTPVAAGKDFRITDIKKQIAQQQTTGNTDYNKPDIKTARLSASAINKPKDCNKTEKTQTQNAFTEKTATIIADTISLAYTDKIQQDMPDDSKNEIPDMQASGQVTSNAEDKKTAEKKEKREPTILLIPKTENTGSEWLLAASMSTGGGFNSKNMYDKNPLSYQKASTSADISNSSAESTLQLLSKQDLDIGEFDADHDLPLSFGISVRKDFNKYIGVETGLTYTYLSSKYKRLGTTYFNVRQELHYLGIPVNLVAYLWNGSRWNIYASGGAMLEKGLKFRYTQDVNDKKSNTYIDNRGSIDGVQWSLNASLGASYMFYSDWSIYFEPRFSYYFDNNQPASIRTEKPSVFGLGAGLRYKF